MKELTITSEDLLRRVTAEMEQLHDSGAGMRLEIAPEIAFAVVAFVQLALRHPEAAAGDSAAFARHFINLVSGKFEPHAPAIAEAIRRGNEPEHDTPADIPPEAFGGKRPPADELRFYRLIEEHTQSEDGLHDYKLACGHLMCFPASLPPSQKYAYCLTCLHAWTERSRQARENIIIPETAPNTKGRDWVRERLAAAEPSSLIEFLVDRKEPAAPEDILEFLKTQHTPAAVLTCPHCGWSMPAPFEKVDLFICAKCGRTVETGPPA